MLPDFYRLHVTIDATRFKTALNSTWTPLPVRRLSGRRRMTTVVYDCELGGQNKGQEATIFRRSTVCIHVETSWEVHGE